LRGCTQLEGLKGVNNDVNLNDDVGVEKVVSSSCYDVNDDALKDINEVP